MITGLMVPFWLLFRLISGQYNTIHPALLEGVKYSVKRHKPDGSRVDFPCPPLVCLIINLGVDRLNQRIGYYNLGRWSRKWWKRVFVYLLECSF